MAWNDRAYRHARRAGQTIATLTPAAERDATSSHYRASGLTTRLDADTPVGATNGNGHGIRYPWDDDAEPA